MPAGDSAQRVAAAASRTEAWARRRAEAFSVGAAGERVVAEHLAPLSATGWILLHDRRAPKGGNVDHVAIGPGGVVILDAKAWTGPVDVVDGRLRCEGKDAHAAVVATADLVAFVNTSLATGDEPEVPTTPVLGCLVFVGTSGVNGLPDRLGDVRLVTVEHAEQLLRGTRSSLTAGQVERVAAIVARMLPPADERQVAPRPEPVRGRNLDLEAVLAVADAPVERRYRFYVARDWGRHGRQRIYLHAPDGTALGWVDRSNGELHDTAHGDASALLLRLRDPKVVPAADVSVLQPVGRLGMKVLGTFGNDRAGVGHVVGRIWRKGEIARLYVSVHQRGDLPADIGWVDMSTGEVHANDPGRAGLVQHTFHVLYDELRRTKP